MTIRLPVYQPALVQSQRASYAQPEALQQVADNLARATNRVDHPLLAALAASHDCTACDLHHRRTQHVPGDGDPQAELCLVGEAPGEQEDREGRPFCGRAGKLLDEMLGAMGLSRDRVFVTNATRCRPPGNCKPEPAERETCRGYLEATLRALPQLRVVALLGSTPARSLLCDPALKITEERGRWRDLALPSHGDPRRVLRVMPTLHPAYLLRNPAAKVDAWTDLQEVMWELGLSV